MARDPDPDPAAGSGAAPERPSGLVRGLRDRLRARLGVRTTTALAAALTVGVVLLVAGAILVLGLNALLRMQLVNAADQQATQLGDRVAANFADTEDVKRNAIQATGKRSDLVEVVTDYNRDPDRPPDVQNIGSSDPLPEYPLMTDVRAAPDEVEVVHSTWITLDDGKHEEVLVVVKGYEFPPTGQPYWVLAAQPLDFLHRAVDTVLAMVLVGIPVLVVLVGGFTYFFAGRALRPVEAMRARVARMSDRDLGTRVPVPPARDEVGRLAETMNQMLGRLENAQTTQRRFVADASHELRSPLATIASGLELLAGSVAEADASTVRTLRGEASRLDRLVDGLLLLARSDERGLQPRREDVDLDEIVEAERGRPSDVGGVAPEVRAEPVRVSGDRAQLVRAVRNLVDNARRHAASRVLVTLRAEGPDAVVDVADDGPGVPPADRDRVFERFVRLDEARARSDGGAGLGLAIVREIVAAHHGSVEVRDSPLGGALFRLRLPLAEAGGATGADPSGPPPTGVAETPEPSAAEIGDAELRDDRPTGPLPVLAPPPRDQETAPVTHDGHIRPSPLPPEQETAPVPRPSPVPRGTRTDERVRPATSVPIRLGDARSPADVNPTAPIPVVRPPAR
ncbi:ATP-binding protein [Pseudonocardia lutea]|uniref:histidine kinase n=1 Tax=Pseudonocardia lutea TaxID=2172015 RepID=A0ABW1IAM0_9PSEU